jgi:hypothetical protein
VQYGECGIVGCGTQDRGMKKVKGNDSCIRNEKID